MDKERTFGKQVYSCKIMITIEPVYRNGEPIISYFGGPDRKYVESFNPNTKSYTTTWDENKAIHFYDDDKCTQCMKQILKEENPWSIVVLDYKHNELIAESVHYPNQHWADNGNLQPSLMNRSVSEFWEQNSKN